MKKLKNKVNDTGNFVCHRCPTEVKLGVVIKGYVYCMKCGEIIKGKRSEDGKLLPPLPKALRRKSGRLTQV